MEENNLQSGEILTDWIEVNYESIYEPPPCVYIFIKHIPQGL